VLLEPGGPAVEQLGRQRPVGLGPRRRQPEGLEEQRERRIDLWLREHRPRRSRQLEVRPSLRREGLGERLLEPCSHLEEDLAEQVVLRREVVDDDPVAGTEPLRQAAVAEPAQPLVGRCVERGGQQLLLGVLVPHPLNVVIAAGTVL
jgi:GNAT superfamily N-acetyltransferase